jgi:hypothetical protein
LVGGTNALETKFPPITRRVSALPDCVPANYRERVRVAVFRLAVQMPQPARTRNRFERDDPAGLPAIRQLHPLDDDAPEFVPLGWALLVFAPTAVPPEPWAALVEGPNAPAGAPLVPRIVPADVEPATIEAPDVAPAAVEPADGDPEDPDPLDGAVEPEPAVASTPPDAEPASLGLGAVTPPSEATELYWQAPISVKPVVGEGTARLKKSRVIPAS